MFFSPFSIQLASGSPRRQQLLRSMELDFELILKSVEEEYPDNLPLNEVAEFLALKKAGSYEINKEKEILITADTVVLLENEILGKPLDLIEAKEMLNKLSGKVHEVITGVCLKDLLKQISFSDTTEVRFRELDSTEIDFYINQFKPIDKAGAYGIQEWIGTVGVESIKGSYNNVMGLPTEKLYRELIKFLS